MGLHRDRRSTVQNHFEALETREVLAADLRVAAGVVQNVFDSKLNADVVRMPIVIENRGDALYAGGTLGLYFSPNDTFGDDDEQFASMTIPRIAPGQRVTLRFDQREAKPVNPPAPGRGLFPNIYNVIAVVPPAEGEVNVADNADAGEGKVDVNYTFGNVNGRTRVPLTVTLNSGSTLTFTLDGPGVGELSNEQGQTIVTLSGTASKSTLLIKNTARTGTAAIGGIVVNGIMKAIRTERVGVSGFVQITGGVSAIALSGLFNSSLTITATQQATIFTRDVELNLGEVTNSIVRSDIPIRSMNLTRWLDTDGSADLLTAPLIGGLNVQRDFQPSLELFSAGSKNRSLNSASIGGTISGAWNLAAGLTDLKAGGTTPTFRATLRGSIECFDINGNLRGTLAFTTVSRLSVSGNIIGATILAGTTLGGDTLLGGTGESADFYSAGFIGQLIVRGGVFSSTIATGLVTTDGVLLNGDDAFATNGRSFIGSIEIRREITGSVFVTPNPPAKSKILLKQVNSATHPQFITSLPRA